MGCAVLEDLMKRANDLDPMVIGAIRNKDVGFVAVVEYR